MDKITSYFPAAQYYMKILILSHRLLLSWAAHFASPVESGGGSSDNCSSIHCVICRSIPSLNEIQVNICTNVPQSLTVLTNAQPIIAGECKWQFRKDQWDCAGITNPIIEEPSLKCKSTEEIANTILVANYLGD